MALVKQSVGVTFHKDEDLGSAIFCHQHGIIFQHSQNKNGTVN